MYLVLSASDVQLMADMVQWLAEQLMSIMRHQALSTHIGCTRRRYVRLLTLSIDPDAVPGNWHTNYFL